MWQRVFRGASKFKVRNVIYWICHFAIYVRWLLGWRCISLLHSAVPTRTNDKSIFHDIKRKECVEELSWSFISGCSPVRISTDAGLIDKQSRALSRAIPPATQAIFPILCVDGISLILTWFWTNKIPFLLQRALRVYSYFNIPRKCIVYFKLPALLRCVFWCV